MSDNTTTNNTNTTTTNNTTDLDSEKDLLTKRLSYKLKEEGNNLYLEEKYERALECYTKAIQLNPNDSIFYSNRSAVNLILGEYKLALKDSLTAINLDKKFTKAYYRGATAYFKLDKYETAIILLDRIKEIEQENNVDNISNTNSNSNENNTYNNTANNKTDNNTTDNNQLENSNTNINTTTTIHINNQSEEQSHDDTTILRNQINLKIAENEYNSKHYPSYKKFNDFFTWLDENEVYYPKLELKYFSDNHRGIYAKTKILKDEHILRIPLDEIITLEMGKETDIGFKMSSSGVSLLSPKHCNLSFYLLLEKAKIQNNVESYWDKYIDILPKLYNNFPIFYSEEELKQLKGSPFLSK